MKIAPGGCRHGPGAWPAETERGRSADNYIRLEADIARTTANTALYENRDRQPALTLGHDRQCAGAGNFPRERPN